MKLLITGATGLIGTAIINDLHQENHEITVLTRNKKHVKQSFLTVYEDVGEIPNNSVFDFIINLAGAPISKRWSEDYKKKLITSRTNITKSLYGLVKRLEQKPKMLISASAIGYYGSQGDRSINEDSSPNNEFTHKLCSLWEQEALQLKELGLNVAIIRLGVVLGANGGILKETVPVFKMCLGGAIGAGTQYMSWVHILDVVRAIKFLLVKHDKNGIYNLTAPVPVTNIAWTKALAKALNRPALLPLPSIIVKFIFGEMGDVLLLHGQKVLPEKLLSAGFEFKYKNIDLALLNILS